MAEKRASQNVKSHRVFGQPRRPAKMFRAGLYARVSTNDQQTIPLQIRALREYAARRGWAIALQVKEVGAAHASGNCGRSCWRQRAAGKSTWCWFGDWTAGADL
jgi:Resolvase, N terminal domain